jgi:predicted acyl esterase
MRARTNEVGVERDAKVTMPDGAVLSADIHHPVGVHDAPTILERTPYSSGSHSYFMEAPDGRATADWISQQPWFNGSLGTFGASYMGFTQ